MSTHLANSENTVEATTRTTKAPTRETLKKVTTKPQTKSTMAGSKGSGRGASGTAKLATKATTDLNKLKKDICDNKVLLEREIQKVEKWNEKSDRNITQLMERVKHLEDQGETHESPEVAEDTLKERMEEFVSDEVTRIVKEQVAALMEGENVTGQIGKIVKQLLGTQGKNGKIMSVDQLSAQGNLRSVEQLQTDQHQYYRTCVTL
jgi:lysozyme family protein